MAMLNIDLSEYDMMRETKANLEKQLAEKETLVRGLEEKSRVVIKTNTVVRDLNLKSLGSAILNQITSYNCDYYYDDRHYRNNYILYDHVIRIVVKIFEHPENYSILKDEYRTIDFSSQYVGFDDIKNKVEKFFAKDYQEELDNLRNHYAKICKEYEVTREEILRKVEDNHKTDIECLKSDHNIQIKTLEDEKIALEDEIKDLKSQITQLNKSTEERVKEAEEEIKKALAAYNDLLYKPKKKRFKLW